MEPIAEEDRDALLASYEYEAVHLEMRDIYATDIERSRFQQWRSGIELDPVSEAEWWRPWFELMSRNVRAGKVLRRLRIVSEPVTEYIHFEWLDAAKLVEAGEDVRWLSRGNASDLLLPGNDFWMFDRRQVAFTYFSGGGDVLGHEITNDPELVRRCAESFENAWKRAISHVDFTPRISSLAGDD